MREGEGDGKGAHVGRGECGGQTRTQHHDRARRVDAPVVGLPCSKSHIEVNAAVLADVLVALEGSQLLVVRRVRVAHRFPDVATRPHSGSAPCDVHARVPTGEAEVPRKAS